MPLDAQIPLMAQGIELNSPLNMLARATGVQNMLQQNRLQGMQMQDMHAQRAMQLEQARARQQFLANLPDPPPDAPEHVKTMWPMMKAGLIPLEKGLEAMSPKYGSAAPGSTIYNERGGNVVATVPERPEKPPEIVRLMEARDALPPGSPQRQVLEAAINKATTHAPAVTSSVKIDNFEPANTQLQKETANSLVKTYESLQNTPSTLAALRQAKALAKDNQFVGSMGDTKLNVAKFFNNNLGTNIAPEQVANAETLRSALFVNVMDNLKKMDAQPSQMQQQMMMDAMGKLTTDPKALPQVISLWEDIIKSRLKEHNRRVGEAKTNGLKFPYDITVRPESEIVMPTADDIAAEARRRAGLRGQ